MSGRDYAKLMNGSWSELDLFETGGGRSDPPPAVAAAAADKENMIDCHLAGRHVHKPRPDGMKERGLIKEPSKRASWTGLTKRDNEPKLREFPNGKGLISVEEAYHSSRDSLPTVILSPDTTKKRRRGRQSTRRSSEVTSLHHGGDYGTREGKRRRSSLSTIKDMKQSVTPAFEPPSVKQRKLRQRRRTITSMLNEVSVSSPSGPIDKSPDGKSFCPVEAARESIHKEIQTLTTQPNELPHMSHENLQLGLSVWDAILRQRQTKVEAQVATIASGTGLSHLRLTRFLKGDGDRSLRASEISKTAMKLKSWLEEFERTYSDE